MRYTATESKNASCMQNIHIHTHTKNRWKQYYRITPDWYTVQNAVESKGEIWCCVTHVTAGHKIFVTWEPDSKLPGRRVRRPPALTMRFGYCPWLAQTRLSNSSKITGLKINLNPDILCFQCACRVSSPPPTLTSSSFASAVSFSLLNKNSPKDWIKLVKMEKVSLEIISYQVCLI